MRIARFAAPGVVERCAVERQRSIADACERIDDSGERNSLAVVDDARALRTGVDRRPRSTPGNRPRVPSISQQQAAQRTPSIRTIASLLPSARGRTTWRESSGRWKAAALFAAIAEVRRADGRSAAQSIVIGESELADPLGHRTTAVATHRVRYARNARLRRIGGHGSPQCQQPFIVSVGRVRRGSRVSQRDLQYVAAAGFDRRVGMAHRKHDRDDARGDRRHQIAAPSQTTGCRDHARGSRDSLTSSGGDGRRMRLRVHPGGDERRVLTPQAIAPCRHHAVAALTDGLAISGTVAAV